MVLDASCISLCVALDRSTIELDTLREAVKGLGICGNGMSDQL